MGLVENVHHGRVPSQSCARLPYQKNGSLEFLCEEPDGPRNLINSKNVRWDGTSEM